MKKVITFLKDVRILVLVGGAALLFWSANKIEPAIQAMAPLATRPIEAVMAGFVFIAFIGLTIFCIKD